jgi:hypothetical protein
VFCSLVCFSIAVYPVHVIEGDRKKVQSLTGQFYFLEENKLARCSYAERRNRAASFPECTIVYRGILKCRPLPRRCRFHVDPCPPVSVSCAPAPQLRLHDAASAACSGLSVCGLSVWPFAYDFLFFRLGSESQFPEFAHPLAEGARPAEGGERGGRGLPAPCLGTAVCCDNLSPRGFWPSGAVIAFRT